ncbi:roadblock/LC7 domain-containing protein [Kitasatospora sp. NBC_01287]|uniref:roadblock/LC7 domain-containing protein n=1 Tax=Kitasatospora sp. NBC_01287 TaxID=2903573 RepID=UPI00225575D8|nr:roadblock/LC7 domain-containing protein [Kitasatospora sp. NBC_01287]MCX4744304.1 roadblock/LC7 domain-containing protein [Kitasatospora sp. NBC_01287]
MLKPRYDRRQLAALESTLLAELRVLRLRVPHLAGGLVAGVNGLLLAHDTHDTDPDGLAALTATALGVAQRLADATGQGEFRESLFRGEHGFIATYAAGPNCVLTLLSHPDVSIGRLRLEGRRSAQRLAEVLRGGEPQASSP